MDSNLSFRVYINNGYSALPYKQLLLHIKVSLTHYDTEKVLHLFCNL